MRKVVDTNFLQDEKLRAYLSGSRQNYAVLTDYAAMEAYKGDTLSTIYRSMEIVAQYPNQVIVLRGTQAVCGLRTRTAGLQRRLIDKTQTREFGRYCRNLEAAKRGNKFVQDQLLRLGREATAHMNRMLADATNFPDIFDGVAKTYTNAEIGVLRTRAAYTPQMVDKLIRNILLLAAHLFRDHPKVSKLPDATELPNSFIFRSSLCAHLLALSWISVGGARNIRPERMRNDLVDINFAAFATYFDGLLTADKKLKGIYQDAVFLLETLFS